MFSMSDHLLFRPSASEVQKFQSLPYLIGITGFEGYKRDLIIKCIDYSGHRYCDKFSKKCNFLVAKCYAGLKYEKAKEWGVSVVTDDWLMQLLVNPPMMQTPPGGDRHSAKEITFDTKSILDVGITPLISSNFI